MSRADLTKAPAEVAAMFDDVAERYDITNDVLALGRTRVWRRAVVDAVDPKPGQFILDLAAGTGTSSVPFAQAAEVFPSRTGSLSSETCRNFTGDMFRLPDS